MFPCRCLASLRVLLPLLGCVARTILRGAILPLKHIVASGDKCLLVRYHSLPALHSPNFLYPIRGIRLGYAMFSVSGSWRMVDDLETFESSTHPGHISHGAKTRKWISQFFACWRFCYSTARHPSTFHPYLLCWRQEWLRADVCVKTLLIRRTKEGSRVEDPSTCQR